MCFTLGATGFASVCHAISLCLAAQYGFQQVKIADKLSQSWCDFEGPRKAEMSTAMAPQISLQENVNTRFQCCNIIQR
jgi:hypothetical protein